MSQQHCIIYTRYSPRPDAKTSESNRDQLALCRQYAADRGWVVREVFDDPDISGREVNRPILHAAIASLRKGDILLVYAADRLWRDLSVLVRVMTLISKRRANVVTVDGSPASFKTPYEECVASMMCAAFKLMAVTGGLRTSAAMRTKQAGGAVMSRRAPYGFWIQLPDGTLTKDGRGQRRKEHGEEWIKRLVPDEAEQAVVGEIAAMLAIPMRQHEIIKTLNARGFKSREGGPWNSNNVRRVVWRLMREGRSAAAPAEAKAADCRPAANAFSFTSPIGGPS